MGAAASCVEPLNSPGLGLRGYRGVPRIGIVAVLLALLVVAGCEDQSKTPTDPVSTLPTPTATLPTLPAESPPAPSEAAVPRGKGFDFYVLALSWSPSYCEAEGENANRQQCESGRPYAFIVHGLWPQYERGYPESCQTSEPDVSNETLRMMYDIMPAAGLIRHQWRKHGTCSGLKQADYFRVLRMAREAVTIPAEFRKVDAYRMLSPRDAEQAFLTANPALSAEDLAVTCDRRYLREVRICLDQALGFRACPEIDGRACRANKVVMPPLRGG